MADAIMTMEHLQGYLHLTDRTIYKLIKNKEIPCAKIGGVWRFDKARIDAWIAQQHEKEKTLQDKNEKLKILVVDDTPEVLEVMSEGIRTQMKNAIVETATNGVQALMAVGKSKPDIMVLDIQMPELNGIEVCRRLKEDPNTQDIFIIAVTGYADKGYKEQVLAAGANAFFGKPFKSEAIVEIIKENYAIRSIC